MKIAEIVTTRASISDPWPSASAGVPGDADYQRVMPTILTEYNGTFTVTTSDDGLTRTLQFMFPDDTDLTEVSQRFATDLGLSDSDRSAIDAKKADGSIQLTVVDE